MSRAEELATQTLDAVGSVRARLGRAVESAEELDRLLWQTEKSLRELPVPQQEEPADAEKRGVLIDASIHGRDILTSVRDSEAQVAEVRDQLAAASAAVTQAKGFLDELEQLPPAEAQQPSEAGERPTPANLRERLTRLEAAIATADAGAGRTAERLDAARGSAAHLIKAYGEYDTRTVASVYQATGALNEGLSGIQAGVGTTSAAHARAVQSTAAADDLATAMRAAANPTSPSAQQTPAAASEQDHRDRAAGPSRGPQQLDR